ncbi:SDR family NAD(P)-dependent oxidoreductase [Christensenella intestinihominis]|uniref:SDR family NAD(P)-dependent oxidoreductase n=1 Tax=Christensenella intestinihominis TaxID=1851429 RepID=UPI000829B01B|nr:SDR family oxidoreductase [Christensenella intestinihominis]
MESKFDLSGKIAIVTGAGQGLGKVFAKALSEAGAEVFLMARNLGRLEDTAREIGEMTGDKTHVCALDITDERSVIAACRTVMDAVGRIDILINNAAVGRSNERLLDESLEEWNSIIGTNLTGTFLMMKHVGKVMTAQRSGKVINLGSMTGHVAMRNPTIGAYDVSKAGIECLTRLMAGVWSEYNVTVNAICPGYYMTDLNQDYVREHPDFYEDSLKQIPLKKWGKPDDIGGIAVFLASAASDYMTGEILVTDGGYTVW